MDDPESNMVCSECYEPYEVTPQTKFRQTPIILSRDISSLPFHIEELSKLITKYILNFDFLEITESRLKLHKNLINSSQ